MPGFMENVGKAAVRGAANVAVKAEIAKRRLQLQGDLDRQEQEVIIRYGRLGRLTLLAAEQGAALPPGGEKAVAAIREAEARSAAIRAELESLGGAPS